MRMKKLKTLIVTAVALLVSGTVAAAIPSTPVTASTDAAKKLYSYFVEQYGQKSISSVMADVNWNNSCAEKVNKLTGKYPAMNCYDFIHIYVPNQGSNGWINYNDITPVTEWYNAGGIVQLMWHFNVPLTETTEVKSNGDGVTCSPDKTTFKASNALVSGTWENKWFYQEMDKVIAVVLKLQQAGIAATWRPFHEAAGNATLKSGASWGKAWFWWGYDGAETYKQLWQTMYGYFRQKGVNNLIWIWTTQNYNGDSNSYNQDTDWYPGDQYVDMVARDLYGYNADKNQQEFTEIQAAYPNKMVVLGECGKGDSGDPGTMTDCWTKGAKWGHFMVWYQGGQGSTSTMCSDSWWKNAMSSANVVTRDQLPNLIPGKVEFETAAAAVKNMGLGWNLGNSLEANRQTVTDVTSAGYWGQQDLTSETCWGQFYTKRELLTMLKNAGFGAIRVPVTWYNHMDSNGQVDAAWMARVREVVDYVVNNGMYCIVNVHHDTGADGDGFTSWIKADATNYANNKARYENLWQQIATEFKDYDEHLLFESYNEMLDAQSAWNYASSKASGGYNAADALKSYNAVNSYAQSFVDVVRATGGNNAVRNIIVNTYAASNGSGTWSTYLTEPLTKMKMPTGEGSHIIFEVHAYPNIENLAQAKTEVDNMISGLNTNLVNRLGAPVIFGEWGTSHVDGGAGKTDYDLRRADMLEFVDYFVKKTKANNMGTFYWMGLTDGMSRLLPAFNQPDLALKMLQAWHGSSYNPTLPVKSDFGDATLSCTVNYNSQYAEFNLYTGSLNASDYKHLRLELDAVPASGSLQAKIYADNEKAVKIAAKNTNIQFSGAGTISRITLQWLSGSMGSVKIKKAYLVKQDNSRELVEPSVFWGCDYSDLDITTGISDVVYKSASSADIYNLNGQRVLSPAKGLYIQGGKKYIKR